LGAENPPNSAVQIWRATSYLVEKADFKDQKQYILTLNSDRFDDSMKTALEPLVRAEFTKKNRFLNAKYQELH